MDQNFNKTMRELYASINENIAEVPIQPIENEKEQKVAKRKILVKSKSEEPSKSESNVTPKTDEPTIEIPNEVKQAVYIRRDIEGGLLTEQSDIEIYKQIQKLDIIQNGLLGDYNESGEYIVDNDVILELVKMLKIYDGDVYLQTMFLTSAAQFGAEFVPLHFSVEIVKAKNKDKLTSKLYLIEDVVQVPGYYKDSPSYLVATYTDDNDDKYTDKMFEVFNIKKTGELIKDDVSLYQNCVNRIKFLSTLKNGLSVTLELEEEKLLKAKLKAYKELGPYGEKILEEYIALHQKLGNLNYRDKNRLLRSLEERNFYPSNQEAVVAKKIITLLESLFASTTLAQVLAAEKNVALKNGEQAKKVLEKVEKARTGVDFYLPGYSKEDMKGGKSKSSGGAEKEENKSKASAEKASDKPRSETGTKENTKSENSEVYVKVNFGTKEKEINKPNLFLKSKDSAEKNVFFKSKTNGEKNIIEENETTK
ncbi:MAG: hypothetical protein WCX32_00950 [Clostridia bacterium]|jgi:hypothetical protein|nr:hypothetical protein [Clostridia bacterium]